MKKFVFILSFAFILCSCRSKYETIYVDDNGKEIYATRNCKKDSTRCLTYASKACNGRYDVIEWVENAYAYRPTIAETAIAITNAAVTKKAESRDSGSFKRKEVLIFSCKTE